MKSRLALLLMVVVLLTAALLRLVDLTGLPPGLHYDEAANAILAGDIGLRGARPLFISAYTGKEVLFFYLAGGVMRLVGESVFSLRLTAALVGLLTVAVTYRLGRALLRDRRTAVFSAAWLAVSFWHLQFSHLGFRAITQPLLQGLTVLFIWHAVNDHASGASPTRSSLAAAVLAGLALGLTGYTYLAARVYPLLLLLALGLPALIARYWRQLLLAVATGFGVLLPLLLYFWRHPDAFWVRIGQVAPGEGSLGLGTSFLRSLGMFFVEGDPYWRFNLPGKPLFSPVGALFLCLGFALVVRRLRGRYSLQERAAARLLTLAPLVMLLPTALAVNEIVPSNLRALGMLPFVMILPAVGLNWILERLAPQAPPGAKTTFGTLIVLVAGGLVAGSLYYRQWGTRADVYYETDADLGAVARFVDGLPDGETVYVAALHYRHPTLAFLSERYDQLKWLPGAGALVAPVGDPFTVVFPHSLPAPSWTDPYLAGAAVETGPEGPDGGATFTAFRFAGSPRWQGGKPVQATLGNAVTLLEAGADAAEAGGTLGVMLLWQVEERPSRSVSAFAHLEDAWGYRWAEASKDPYPSEQWTAGEQVLQRVQLTVPAGAPPGAYRVRVGWFDRETGDRLPLRDAEGRYAGSAVTLEDVALSPGALPADLPEPPLAADPRSAVAPGLSLLGYGPLPGDLDPGQVFDLALWWWATRPLPEWHERIFLVDQSGEDANLFLGAPVRDTLSFATWSTPTFVIDRQRVRVPVELSPGVYGLHVVVADAAGTTVLSQRLAEVEVGENRRTTDTPDVMEPIRADFGAEIRLLGANRDDDSLTLVWQALTEPAADYSVFVHVLDANGVCCLWQADGWPAGGTYPTSTWLTEEVVLDAYDVSLPPEAPAGSYTLEVGLYIADTGQRLQVARENEPWGDAVLLSPWVAR